MRFAVTAVFRFAGFAANEEIMACVVVAIPAVIRRLLAELAMRDDAGRQLTREAHAHALVEDEARTVEVAVGILLTICHDAAFELSDVGKSVFSQERTCSFTADAARAVRDDATVFVVFELGQMVRQIPEVVHRERNGVSEFSDRGFVVVAHVDQHQIFASLELGMEFVRRDIWRRFFRAHFLSQGHDFGAQAHEELLEDVIDAFGFFEDDV